MDAAQEKTPETSEKIREISCDHDAGFGSLPHQIVKLRMQQGFAFNILLIGETGIGKTTLIRSLFNIAPDAPKVPPHVRGSSRVSLKSRTYELRERGIHLKLTVVETVGYGDQINRREDVAPIADHVDDQFERYFREELRLRRSLDRFDDTRIHACLYFVCPTGHSLKSTDLYCLKKLSEKVNIIPVVAKSDCLSREELCRFKAAVRREIEEGGIRVYAFPTDDEEVAETNRKSNELVPFAVAASEDSFGVGSRRARVYPWGVMQVENEEHSEFLALRRALIDDNMEDLREKTHAELYEIFRRARMVELGFPGDGTYSLGEFYQRKRGELRKEVEEKEKKLKEAFIEKVRAKEEEIKIQESLLRSKYDAMFEKMKAESVCLSLKTKNARLFKKF